MRKNSFKKLVALFTMLIMVLGVVAVPNAYANADETAKGDITYANNYDWTNQSKMIYAFASASAEASISTLTAQGVGTFQWFTFVILERNEDYNYVVKSVVSGYEGNQTDGLGLGEGKVIIMVHGDAAADNKASYDFFTSLKENDVLAASTYWENIAGASGVPAGLSFTKAAEGSVGPKAPTKGTLNVVNGIGRLSADGSNAYDICVAATADSTKTVKDLLNGSFNWWNSILLEKDATKGTWVVKAVDANAADGVCAHDAEKLGENRILIGIHAGVEDKESAAFFLGTAQVGQEYYLVGEIPTDAAFSQDGTKLTDVYLTTEKPAPAPSPEPSPAPVVPETGDLGSMGTTVVIAAMVLVGAALILKKRNNLA